MTVVKKSVCIGDCGICFVKECFSRIGPVSILVLTPTNIINLETCVYCYVSFILATFQLVVISFSIKANPFTGFAFFAILQEIRYI